MSRLSAVLMSVAIWLLPPRRKDWGEAMRGEFEALETQKIGFAIGCLTTSLRENLTSKVGVARLGFVFLQALASVMMVLWILGLVTYLSAPRPLESAVLVKIAAWLPIGFMPVIIWYTAVNAASAPINRFAINKLGAKMESNLMLAMGLHLAVTFLANKLACFLTAECSNLGFMVNASGALGTWFVIAGTWSKFVKVTPRRPIGSRLSAVVAFSGIFSLILPKIDIIGDMTRIYALGLPLILMAIAGVVSMWMNRPAKPAPQP